MTIAEVIHDSDSRAGRTFDAVVLALIVYSIVTFSAETLPNLSESTKSFLHYSEIVVTGFFTLEYIARVLTSKNKLSYIFSFYGIIDLIAILPFYLSLGFDLRSIRVIRLFRVFRLFKLSRYSKALNRLGKALALAKTEAVLFLMATAILLYLSAVGIYYFEHEAQPENFQSIFHSLWWAVATLTTVGYGDVYPVTVGGRLFTFVILMVGLGIVAVPAGIVASALSEVKKQEDERE